jgi:hypothetical protein
MCLVANYESGVGIGFTANDVKDPQCSASLSTTITILSSLQTQKAAKFLLNFGKIVDFIQYSALNGTFLQVMSLKDEHW